MTLTAFLHQATQALSAAGISSARLDCLVLLEDALGQDRAHLLAHPEAEIPKKTEVELNKKIAQRAAHKPLAYIRGKAPFYGREFAVNEHVLVPRPETETLIALLQTLPLRPKPRIADIGTGSGCLAITAALVIPGAQVDAYDVSESALGVAKQNAQTHNASIHFYQSDLLQNYKPPADVILANLPYVPDDYAVNQAAGFEPRLALFAGKDGLTLYRRFWAQLAGLNPPPRFVITESLPEQHHKLAQLAAANGYHLQQTDGLAQCFAR